jgi:hypothetical protein
MVKLHLLTACLAPWLQGAWDERDPAKRIPNPLLPGLLRFIKGVICAVVWMKLSTPYGAGEGALG